MPEQPSKKRARLPAMLVEFSRLTPPQQVRALVLAAGGEIVVDRAALERAVGCIVCASVDKGGQIHLRTEDRPAAPEAAEAPEPA